MAFCQNCGAQLSTGVHVCPNCGASVYNTGGSGNAPSAPFLPSTVSEMAPTVFGTPPPPPPEYAGRDKSGPYAPPVSTSYGAPPYTSFGAPQPIGYGAPPQPGGYGMPPQQPQKKSRAGLIIGIIAAIVLLIGIGVVVAVIATSNHKNTASTGGSPTVTNSTPTSAPTAAPTSAPTTSSNSSPSGNQIDPAAASIITNPVIASAVDSNYRPTTTANTFQLNQKVYVTFGLNLNGSTGYVEAKWYVNDQLYVIRQFSANNPDFVNGYFWQEYSTPGQGTVELYWCTQSDCSDAALATFVSFTISSSSYHIGNQPPLAFAADIWRRN